MDSNPVGTQIFSRSHARVTLFHISTTVIFKECLLRNTKECCVVFMTTCYCFKLGVSSKLCPGLKLTHSESIFTIILENQ